MEGLPPFHLAIKVRDLAEARRFYGELLGCPEGRSSTTWVDFNFFGHQLVCHIAKHISLGLPGRRLTLWTDTMCRSRISGQSLKFLNFESLSRKLEAAGDSICRRAARAFKGQPGEQATMFLLDPSGNAIEFKAFRNIREQLFAK